MATKRDGTDIVRRAAEKALVQSTTPTVVTTSPEALLHELQVHQIELQMQNKVLQQAQIRLEAARDRYESLFNFAPVAYLSLSRHGIVVEANLAAGRLLGRTLANLIRKPFEDFIAEVEHDHWRDHFSATWKGPSSQTQDLELQLKGPDGSSFPAQLQCMAVDGPNLTRTLRLALFDITERSRVEAEVQRQAHYDALTHLPNRRLLQDRLEHALASTARTGLHGAILFLDLDTFKTLNDRCGHDAGDRLLVEVAQRLKSGLREGDTVARIGGDEFVMILENLSTDAQAAAVLAKQIGEKLREAIAHRLDTDGAHFQCSASIGVRLFEAGESVDDLFKQADLAMYQAKAAGRNQLRFFDPSMQAALDERSRLERTLALAIGQNELELYYQPQFNGLRQIVGAEALLRWHHPDRGLIEAEHFIALSDQSSLLRPIGDWVLGKACETLACWSRKEHSKALMLAINISASQFRQADFVDQVRCALAAHGAHPRRLVLELSEPTLLANPEDATRKLKEIRRLGVRLSIEHFGTGCSSLSNLTHHLIDQLKIDRSFVQGLHEHDSDDVAVTAIITMARSLGLSIVAHGVETEAQRARLAQRGCDVYQGLLFSAPLPLDGLERVLIDSTPTAFESAQTGPESPPIMPPS